MALGIDSLPAKKEAYGWAKTIVGWLVEPSAAVDEKRRRRLRLLSAYLLLMAANTFIGALMMRQQEAVMVLVLLIAGVALFLGYILSRTRYRGAAITIAVGIPAVPVLTMLFLNPERQEFMQQLPWLALPLFVCSLLLSLRSTIIIASVYVLVLSTLTFSLGIPGAVSAESLAYLIMIIFFVVAITAIRQQDQRELELQLHEREQAEDALKESEEKFSSVFKNSPIAICIVSVADSNFIETNESFTRFTGYSPQEIIGHTPVELSLFVSEQELNRMATELQENNKIYDQEFRSRRKSGEVRMGLFSAEVININGKPCVIMVIADITERKRAEQYQKDENHILTLMSQGTPLKDLLDAILLMGEARDPSIKGSVFLVDPAKKMLFQVAAPSLSEDFNELARKGFAIREGAGSCGTAAYRKQRVIVPDIGNSSWFHEEALEVTRRNNMLSCWSQPIMSSTGELLGTICSFGNKLGGPDEQDIATLEWSAQRRRHRYRAEAGRRRPERV